MAEEALVADEQAQQQISPHEVTVSENLANQMWGVEPTQTVPIQVEPTIEVAAVVETKVEEKPKEEVFDEAVYIKNNYGYETPETLKQDLENYKKLKDTKPEELKFENDESKVIFELIRQGKKKEVREILDRQEKIELYTSVEVNSNTAEEILKFVIEAKNQSSKSPLTKEEIDFKYKQDYGTPKQPVQKLTETEDEFTERMDEWKERVATVEMRKVVDAKMSLPQLEQLKQKIVLPEIENRQTETSRQPTQEELDSANKYHEAYVKSVDASVKDFNGFSVKVKNEDIGLPETAITYSVIDAEKNILGQQMKDFVNANYDMNALFHERWVNEDKTLKTGKIAEDRYLLDNKDKIFQKIANDSANVAVEAYIKGKKNINFKDTQTTQTEVLTSNAQTDMDAIRQKIFG